jgi:hypothetical protein
MRIMVAQGKTRRVLPLLSNPFERASKKQQTSEWLLNVVVESLLSNFEDVMYGVHGSAVV